MPAAFSETKSTTQEDRTLFAKDIPARENVANLNKLPLKGFFVIALPMKIEGGSGGPVRNAAVVPGGK